jgi:fumarate reductase subunit D
MSEIPPPTVPPATPPPTGGSYTPPGGSYTPPPPPPPGMAPPGGSSDRTLMVVLAYISFLCLIPLLTKKDDPDVYWHAKNGLGLFLTELVWIVLRIMFIFIRIPFLGCGMTVISCAIWLGFLAITILCIMKAVNGQRFRIPVITDFAEKM